MTRAHLRRASEELRAAAASATGEERDRLETQAEQVESLADTGADHGRLARHENALRELEETADAETSERIDAAMTAIRAYRETIEGV